MQLTPILDHAELAQLHVGNLTPTQHLCCIFESEEEHQRLLTEFLIDGLRKKEKVFYIVDAHTAETILGYLHKSGCPVSDWLNHGDLTLFQATSTYTRGGKFDPEAMIALLCDETAQAVKQGYTALRVTGEMSWALKGLPGSNRLLEYESKLNSFFSGHRCLAICQYDRRRFASELLLKVLQTHPLAAVGAEVFENFYYMPPEDFLAQDVPAAMLKNSIQQLRERKKRDELLFQAANELRRSNRDLEQFAYIASHDLQEPVRMIQSFGRLLEKRTKNLSNEEREYLKYMTDGARHIGWLIEGLLTFCKIQIEPEHLETTNVAELLKQVLLNLKPMLEEHQAEVSCGSLPTIQAFPVRLSQVFQNLISNGVKFRSDKLPRIHIAAERKEGHWLFSVSDNGIGIEEEYFQRIFIMFQRLHDRNLYKGSGIGLTICKRIVEQHGGQIWLTSKKGEGTTFYFTIPDPKPNGANG